MARKVWVRCPACPDGDALFEVDLEALYRRPQVFYRGEVVTSPDDDASRHAASRPPVRTLVVRCPRGHRVAIDVPASWFPED